MRDDVTLTTLHLNPSHPHVLRDTGDLCAMHGRVVAAAAGLPEDPAARVLWATPGPWLLVIRALGPIPAAAFPTGYTTHVEHRPWPGPPQSGRATAAAVVSPQKSRTPRVDGVRRGAAEVTPLKSRREQVAYLRSRLAGMLDIDTVDIGQTRTRVGRHRTGNLVTSYQVHAVITGTVLDGQALAARALAGLGKDKTWGAGLTVWQAA